MVDRGTGIPIVLLPGIQGRWEWMAPAVDALAARCRVVTFSFCDEPSSGFPCEPAKGVENYFEQIERALDRVSLDEVVLVGVSYSGPIAAEFAVRYPRRVRGLVLASALPCDWTPNARARFYLSAPRLLSPVFLIDSPLRVMPEIRAALPRISQRLQFSLGQLQRVAAAPLSPSRMARRLRWSEAHTFADPSTLEQPMLVITGEDRLDRVVQPELTRRYLACVRHARHVVLPRTGHIGVLTKPHDFAALVHEFGLEGHGSHDAASAAPNCRVEDAALAASHGGTKVPPSDSPSDPPSVSSVSPSTSSRTSPFARDASRISA